jgi:sterol desaturase/sphingolipid hydroxylase (fatty acid hydroxylase superfamily)
VVPLAAALLRRENYKTLKLMMNSDKSLKSIAIPVAALGAFALLVWLEKRRPLRRSAESKTVRTLRNLCVAGAVSVPLYLAEKPVIDRLTKLVEKHNFGLLKIIKLPRLVELALAVFLLDYTLYLWHVLTHKVPFLWRFHLVHHVDLDLDGSTGFRFHFGEILISVFWRAMQILLIGTSPESVRIWQNLLFVAVAFHHSNINLPVGFEDKLSRVFITPRLHGIHHSAKSDETNSNWSSGLSIWDRIHGTLKQNVEQDEIIIGVSDFQNPANVELSRLLRLPFEKQKPSWQS